MNEEIIDLVALRKPLPKVRFPNGKRFRPNEVDATVERLRLAVVADPGNEDKIRAVLRAIVPDASDEDWETLTPEDVGNLYSALLRKQAAVHSIVEARRKNEDAGNAQAPTTRSRRSSRTTTSRTSARESPAPTGSLTGT